MKISLPVFALTALILSHSPIALAENRITTPGFNAAIRCGGKPVPTDQCSARQKHALSEGCITQDEYNTLVKIGAVPSCDSSYTGLDMLEGWCPCGCFHPDTWISVTALGESIPSHARAGDIAVQRENYSLMHLVQGSRMKDFEIKPAPVRMSTIGPEPLPLVVIQTEDGRILKVTTKHAVLLANGEMVQAQNIEASDFLVDQKGDSVAIRSVGVESFDGDVVNFQADVDSPEEHLIFAEGLTVGDQAWQSTLDDEQNRILVRQ